MSINSGIVRCRKCGQPTTDIEELTAETPLCAKCKEKPIVYSRKWSFLGVHYIELHKEGFILQTFRGIVEKKSA